uniref:Uncharacterized protein n=1 Tax=viral metagenome TaxID=1070528 RepID=A0A6H1ZXK7_9ZZZZ
MEEDKYDKRNFHKLSPAEIESYLKKLPCSVCGRVRACKCDTGPKKKREK